MRETLAQIWSYLRPFLAYILAAMLLVSIFKNSQLDHEVESLTDAVTYQGQQTRVWRDRDSLAHAENAVLQLDKATMEKLYAKELAKNTGFKPQNITSHTSATTSNKGKSAIPLSQGKDFQYNEGNWLKLSGSILNDTLFLDRELSDSLVFVTGHKRRLFRPDTYTVEAVSFNPMTSINTVRRVELRERPKRFGLGVGVYYTVSGPTVGAGLQYNVVRF